MKRGRPISSEVRDNIVEILYNFGPAYGYQIHRFYNEIFPATTRENIYYNLRKGAKTGVFELTEVKVEKGDYSWGTAVEKKYYKLGPNAAPKGDSRVKQFFDELKEIEKQQKV